MDGLEEILSFVNRFEDAQDEAIDLLLDQLYHESLRSSIIDKEAVHRVISLLLEAEAADEECPTSSTSLSGSSIRVIDAFLIPKFQYDPIRKHFFGHNGSLPIHGEASAKAALYRDRFLLLFQRVARDQHFIKPAFDTDETSESCQVITCGFPPIEDRDKSLKLLAGHDFFGGGTLTKEETLRLADLEKRAVNDMFVIMSDVWLDNEEVMEKLETVLNGFESVEIVPSLFVFMGKFCSRPCNLSFHNFSSLRLQFGKLGQMIEAHPRLKEQSRFLFIPGPDDAGPSTVLPRCALPKYLTEELQKHVPNAIFSSNPCRVKFYTQEIVFFRQDLLYRMRRSCLIPPSTEETDDPFEHLVATIIHQSHLCPLPLFVQPIIWNYDHGLQLYPTPHTIILGDRSEQKAFKYTGITCFNPGSFSDDGTFVAYRPCTQEIEFSAV
ncbi:DNA polymerase alpha/epsilon, subunit B [Corchorus olitorius]|uniref:DNA polymerase II subunit 2 n=1 Tax=Corchorus olitorius TaxID=93759 RepID=A0A1R3HTF3_9ROSI|nr:DNA polymerase alpha/epsilon, subunit B [Corchorus olitorius]